MMVQIVLEINVAIYTDTDETARASRIDKGFQLVGGAYERGVATILLDGLAVWRTELHVARRQEIFQHYLLRIGGLVELVDIYQRK